MEGLKDSKTNSFSSQKSGNWFVAHKILSTVLSFILLIVIISVATASNKPASKNTDATISSTTNTSTSNKVASSNTNTPATSSTKTTTAAITSATTAPASTTSKPPSKVATRQVTGTATTLGAGTFTGGTDVAVGLYNITTTDGQSGNFIVSGNDNYDEILGVSDDQGVTEIRVQISSGDSIQISGLSTVIFTPVTTPFNTAYATTSLYTGTFTVGQDIGAGRYVVTPAADQSGNFFVTGTDNINEILGGDSSMGEVPSVTTNLTNGDVIQIEGMTGATLTPTKQ